MNTYYWDKNNCAGFDNFYGSSLLVVVASSIEEVWEIVCEQQPRLYQELNKSFHNVLGDPFGDVNHPLYGEYQAVSEQKQKDIKDCRYDREAGEKRYFVWEQRLSRFVKDKLKEQWKFCTDDAYQPSILERGQSVYGKASD